jgi:D-alanine-D-alanine ligase
MAKKKLKVAVLFGGRSSEHEISIITALDLITATDTLRFEVLPVYISAAGRWYTGDALLERSFYKQLAKNLAPEAGLVQEVTLLPIPGELGLRRIKHGAPVLAARRVIPVDVYFPAFHGQFGEDGCLQGLFEMADVAYTGSNVLASSMAMSKYACKLFLQAHGIPVLPAALVQKDEVVSGLAEVRQRIRTTPGLEQFPLFIKPCNLGSSVGIGRAENEAELDAALAKVFRYDYQAIVEPCVSDMFEINVSVLDQTSPRASVVEIPVSGGGTLTYEDKYVRGAKKGPSQGMASLVRVIDPPDLPQETKQKVIQSALLASRVLGSGGVSRFDFIVDKRSGLLYFNELNPFPGSMAYYLWAKSTPRLLYTEMITTIVERALAVHQTKASLQRDFGFKALFSA